MSEDGGSRIRVPGAGLRVPGVGLCGEAETLKVFSRSNGRRVSDSFGSCCANGGAKFWQESGGKPGENRGKSGGKPGEKRYLSGANRYVSGSRQLGDCQWGVGEGERTASARGGSEYSLGKEHQDGGNWSVPPGLDRARPGRGPMRGLYHRRGRMSSDSFAFCFRAPAARGGRRPRGRGGDAKERIGRWRGGAGWRQCAARYNATAGLASGDEGTDVASTPTLPG